MHSRPLPIFGQARTPQVFSRLDTQFQQSWPKGHLALMYHKLGPPARPPRIKGLYVAQKLWREQLSDLQASGRECLTPDQWSLSPSGYLLTFDDGFRSVFDYGLPELAARGLTAIQFLVADRLGDCNRWDLPQGETAEPLMDAVQIREWLAAGHHIGAHTRTHPHLSQLSLADAKEEIFGGKAKLEDLFGLPLRHFCYPYGDFNEAIIELVQKAGFSTAWTTRPSWVNAGLDPWQLPRFMARHRTRSLLQFCRSILR
jgi:peptidoglycan/xylan/chitin deacetylase (PgdA/CDA1 family)